MPRSTASIEDLPLLGTSTRMRFGLEKLQVNMLIIKGPRIPRTFAMINGLPINEGEIIPNTRAELVKIESHGIAIEILSTRNQYYIPY